MSPQAVQTKPLDFSFLELPSDRHTRKDIPADAKNVKETPNTFEWTNADGSTSTLYKNPGAHAPELDEYGTGRDLAIEPTDDSKLNFDFLDAKPVSKTTAQTWRELQASRFPTKAEGGDPDEVAAKPLSSILSPAGLWTQAKTAAYDLLSPLSLLRNAKSFSPGLELVRGLKTLSEDLGASRERSETAAGKAMAEGDYPVGVSKALLNMIPVVGPMVSNIADEGADPSKIAGHAEAAIFGKKVYEAAGSPIKTASGAYRGVKNAAIDLANGKFEPHIGLMKALRPKNTNLKFSTTAEKAMKAINDTGAKPRDIHELDAATETAIHDLVSRQKAIVGNRPTRVSGKPIAAAIKKSVPKLFRHENPDVAMDIDAWADKTYDRDFTVEELDEFRKDANAKTSGYHNTKMPNQQMALDRTLDSAIAVNKANAIRETLYDGLDVSQGTGTALREINQRIRSLLTVKDALDRRWNVELRQAAQNLPQQVSKLMAFGRFAKAAKMMVAHNPVGAAGEALVGLGEVGLADFMKELNSTNGQVASAFRRYRFKSDPLVMNPIPRAAANRALTQGTTAASPKATVQPQTLTGQATPGQPLTSQGWNQQRAIQLASSTSLRDRLGRMKPANAQYHTGELPTPIRPVGRSATGQMEQVWKTALKQHTKTMKDVLHAGEEPLKRDPKTGRFLKRDKGAVTIEDSDLSAVGKELKKWGFPVTTRPMPTKVGNSFIETGGYLITNDGEWVSMKGKPHAEAIDAIDSKYSNAYRKLDEAGWQDENGEDLDFDSESLGLINEALQRRKLIRVATLAPNGNMDIQILHKPSRAALAEITGILKERESKNVTWEFEYDSGYGTPAEFIKALNKEFPR